MVLPPSALDVAREFFALAKAERCADLTTWKLQKLLYRAQSLSQYERGRELFGDPVKAWKDGPVVPAVHHETKGLKRIPFSHEGLSKPSNLAPEDRELVHAVWTRYKHLSGDQMSEATHLEDAWKKARSRATLLSPSPAIKDEDMRADVEQDREQQKALFDAFVAGMEADA